MTDDDIAKLWAAAAAVILAGVVAWVVIGYLAS